MAEDDTQEGGKKGDGGDDEESNIETESERISGSESDPEAQDNDSGAFTPTAPSLCAAAPPPVQPADQSICRRSMCEAVYPLTPPNRDLRIRRR